MLFDALQSARARKADYVIADTAGRLQTKTNLMAELEKMRRELAEFKAAAPQLSLAFANGDSHGQFTARLVREFDASALCSLCDAWRAKHPRITGMPDAIDIPTALGGGTIRLPNFTGVPGFVSAEDAAEYNAELDRIYACYEQFLRDWPAAVSQYSNLLASKSEDIQASFDLAVALLAAAQPEQYQKHCHQLLERFAGTAVFVSHDRYFLDRIADRILEVADGDVRSTEGGWSWWRARQATFA